jgi:ABC-type glycerol-3-phosphate transport system substrate-binding protein
LAGCGTAASPGGSKNEPGVAATGPVGDDLTVWVDALRLPAAEAYAKEHPNVHLNIVTYDGDGNGATTLQTKIQLWNRTGNGWPDVVFSQQVNDPVWMAQKPFDFAAPVNGLIPDDVLGQWPAPSRANASPAGRRRWCSMAVCGNRAKATRHRRGAG